MIGLNLHGQKLHGMKDNRWTTFQKVTQYKDVISLQNRDKEVTVYEKIKNKRHEEKALGDLRKLAKLKQDKLRNALLGNQNRMWSTLGEHRTIQLAQGRNKPEDVIENLYQMIDYKRKLKDKYNYNKKKLMEKYKNLVLKKGEQDILLMMQKSGIKTPLEKKMTFICLEKQNYQMRRIAATSIKETYIKVLKVLKKDAIYYESVLDCLEADSYDQSKMLLEVTEMGQIVTEYLDDITVECNNLEQGIKYNMREREKTLREYTELLNNLTKAFKKIVRSDSDILILNEQALESIEHDKQLSNELENVSKVLLGIQIITKASGYEYIYPSLLTQKQQRQRLETLAQNTTELYRQMRLARLQLEAILNLVSHTYNQEKIEYLERKRSLLRETRNQQKKIGSLREREKSNGDMLLKIRNGLNHLSNILKVIRAPGDPPSNILFPPDPDSEENIALLMVRAKRRSLKVEPFRVPITSIPEGENSIDLLDEVNKRLAVLFKEFKPIGSMARAAEVFFSRKMSATIDWDEKEKEIDLLEGLIIEDLRLPNNASVHAASAQFVKDNTVDELALVAAQVAARKKPGAYFRKLFMIEARKRKENMLHGKCCSPY